MSKPLSIGSRCFLIKCINFYGTLAPSKGEAPASEGEPEEAKKDGILPSTGEEAVQTAGIAAGLAAMGGLFLTLFRRKNKGSDQE